MLPQNTPCSRNELQNWWQTKHSRHCFYIQPTWRSFITATIFFAYDWGSWDFWCKIVTSSTAGRSSKWSSIKRLRNAWDKTCKWQSQQTIVFRKHLWGIGSYYNYLKWNAFEIVAVPQEHFHYNFWKFTASFPYLPASIQSRWILCSKQQKVRIGFHKFLSFRNK